MNVTVILDEDRVESIMGEAVNAIVDKYLPAYLNAIVKKTIETKIEEYAKSISEEIISKQDVYGHLKSAYYMKVDKVIDREMALAEKRSYRTGIKKEMGSAIREIIYENKDGIINDVTQRATKVITAKGKIELMKTLLEDVR